MTEAEDLAVGVEEDPAHGAGEQGQHDGVEGDDGAVIELMQAVGAQFDLIEGCVEVVVLVGQGLAEDGDDRGQQHGVGVGDQTEAGRPELGVAVGGGAFGHQHHGVGAALAGGAAQLGGHRVAAEAVPGFGPVDLQQVLHQSVRARPARS